MDMVEPTINGLTQMQQMGLSGIFLSFLFIGAITAIWYFARNCDRRTEASIEAFRTESQANREVVSKNTEAFQGVQVALARMEVKLDK